MKSHDEKYFREQVSLKERYERYFWYQLVIGEDRCFRDLVIKYDVNLRGDK
jgi:hypothetical protein